MKTPALRIGSNLRLRIVLGLASFALLLAPLAARAGEHPHSTRSTSVTWSIGDDDSHFSWSLFDADQGNLTGNTDGDDWQDVRRSLADEKGQVFWFKIDGDRYVVRDLEIVGRAQEITRPMRELGKKQGELGRRQGALGREQGQLGREQGRLGRRQAILSQRLAAYAVDEARGGESHRAERRAIERELDEISGRMSELGEQQGALGAKQGPLGEQQGELGRQQGELSKKVSMDLRKIAEEALRDGKAQRLGGTRRRTI